MERKKKLIATVIAVTFLVFLVISAAYAYFGFGALMNTETQKLTIDIGELGNIAIVSGNHLSLDLSKNDMYPRSNDVIYYASSNGKTEVETTESVAIASSTVDGNYNCNYTLNVVASESSMYDAFQNMETKSEGQIILTINGKEYDFNTESLFPLVINGKLNGVSKQTPQNIEAGLKVINKAKIDQSDLAGKDLTLNFSVESFSCQPVSDNILAGVENVSEELVGGMYRFQGDATTVNNNYVCFGTNSLEECTTGDMRAAYLYRIIGVNENNELKLVQHAPAEKVAWHSDSTQDVEWPNSDAYTFITTMSQQIESQGLYYEGWEDLVVLDAKWKYGDVYDAMLSEYTASGNPNNIDADFFYNLESNFTNELTATMGLMYAHDYLYSGSESKCMVEDNAAACKNSWLHISNSWYYTTYSEWFMTRGGYVTAGDSPTLVATTIDNEGMFNVLETEQTNVVRISFYLKPSVTLTGSGTLEDPYFVS